MNKLTTKRKFAFLPTKLSNKKIVWLKFYYQEISFKEYWDDKKMDYETYWRVVRSYRNLFETI